MIAASINQAMEYTLRNSGEPRNAILLGAGSEESIERSEVSRIVPDVAEASLVNIRKVLGRPAVSPEVHYNGLVFLEDQKKFSSTVAGGSLPVALGAP